MPKKNSVNYKKGGSAPRREPRRVSIRAELRQEPDVRKYARAVIALALAQAEREAAAERDARTHVGPEPPL